MKIRMDKEQFIESMREAKEKEYSDMAADTEKETKEAKKDENATCGNKKKVRIPLNWQRRIEESIELMLAESGEKLDQAQSLISEAESLTQNVETLKEMVK